MRSNLPLEILEHIFTDSSISKTDLLELQLTCKQWSLIAKRNLYKEIDLQDENLYGTNSTDQATTEDSLASLIESLNFDSQSRKYIKVLDFGSLFENRNSDNFPAAHPQQITQLLYLCPNITTLIGYPFPAELHDLLPRLRQQGHLQHLERFSDPDSLTLNAKSITSYYTALLDFKDKVKEIAVLDGVDRVCNNECLIPPASLQLFPCAEDVVLAEKTRIHLYRLRDYIANCGPNVKRLDIRMAEEPEEPPQVEYNGQSDVHPQENLQELIISLFSPLSCDELAFIMRMFPSLKALELMANKYWYQNLPREHNMQVFVQFFRYVSLIPQVECRFLWCSISEGLDVLPHMVNTINVEKLVLYTSKTTERTGLAIGLECSPQARKPYTNDTTTSSRNTFTATIQMMCSSDTHSTFNSALKNLKSDCITSISIGPRDYFAKTMLQEINSQEAVDYIMDNYSGIQDLTFSRVEFPTLLTRSEMPNVRQLQSLHIDRCNINEYYFARLSCQFDRIDRLKHTDVELNYDEDENNEQYNPKRVAKIHLPYTRIGTFTVSRPFFRSCIFKVWMKFDYITLEASRTENGTVAWAVYDESDNVYKDYVVIIYCASLKQIDCEGVVFKLPSQ